MMVYRIQMTPILRLYACIALISGAASALKGNQYSRLRGQGSKNTHLEGGSRGLQKGHKGREAQLEQYSDSEQDFFNFCTEELLSDAVVGDGIISQNDFGDKMGLFCRTFTAPTFTNVDCPATTFTSLSVDVQLIFLIAVCPKDEGKTAQMDCLHSLDSLNGMGADFGYIVSSEMMPEVENTVENLCFELVPVVFAPPENGDTTVAETASPVASPTPSPIEEKLSDEEAIAGEEIGEQNQGGAKDPINAGEGGDGVDQDTVVVAENGALGTGPIIGIATAAAAALLFFFLVAGRRHSDNDREKELGEVVEGDESFMSEGTPDLKYFAGTDALADTGEKSSVSKKRSIGQFDPSGAASIALGRRDDDAVNRSSKASGTSSVDQIVSAIDQANWDEVYKLASQLAEQEDLSTLSSVGKQNARRAATGISTPTRTHLSEEDQGRTRTLDELVDGGDWTGVAVTAALYAGERGSSGAQSSAKRSFFDIVTGKRATSTLAASASQEEDTLGIMRPFTTSALGALTDDTKSGTTDEVGTSFDASSPQRSPVFKHVPPAGAFGLLPSNPTSSDSSVTLARLKERIDAAVDCGDWDAVLMLSSEVESNSSYQHTYAQFPHTPMKSLESGSTSQSPPALRDEAALDVTKVELNRAINLGDWVHVGIYANMIAENKPMESRALVPSNQPQSIVSKNSEDTSGSEMAKRHTIEKLVQAGKWKGVSIMAGLYEMESTGAVSSQARGNENLALTESEDAQPWFKIFSSSSKDSQDDRKPASRGWTGMINLSRANDETPQKTKVIIPGDQKSPPPLMKKEEVQLRNTTELRDADRVDGDILRPTETGPAGFKRVESQDPNAMQGAKLLLPYWHKKGGKSDPPEGSNV